MPEGGVPTKPVTLEEIEANQDELPPKGFDREAMREQIRKWNEWRRRPVTLGEEVTDFVTTG